ncbi:unnamed protein product, partial [Prunus brigantina]
MSNNVRDLCTIRSFGVCCRPSPNPKIIEITWHPPSFDYHGCVLRAFCSNLDVPSAVYVEVLYVIRAIKLAWLHAWHNVWIETDSLLGTQFFRSPHLVPWHLRVDWQNCCIVSSTCCLRFLIYLARLIMELTFWQI